MKYKNCPNCQGAIETRSFEKKIRECANTDCDHKTCPSCRIENYCIDCYVKLVYEVGVPVTVEHLRVVYL